MTREEAAQALNGKQYTEEGTREFFKELKKAGIVAVYGQSDDLMEFAGAIDDEVGAYDGATVFVNEKGIVKNECDEGDECPNWRQSGRTIDAIWCPEDVVGNPSWSYKTDIPHDTFNIMEDNDLYCIGIVFYLKDAA